MGWVAPCDCPQKRTPPYSSRPRTEPIAISLVAFVFILGGAFAGTLLRKVLPDRSVVIKLVAEELIIQQCNQDHSTI